MQGEISSREFAEWLAYYRLEPFGEERADLRNARLMALLAQINGDGSREFSPADFMPDFGSVGLDRTEEVDVAEKARALFGGFGLDKFTEGRKGIG